MGAPILTSFAPPRWATRPEQTAAPELWRGAQHVWPFYKANNSDQKDLLSGEKLSFTKGASGSDSEITTHGRAYYFNNTHYGGSSYDYFQDPNFTFGYQDQTWVAVFQHTQLSPGVGYHGSFLLSGVSSSNINIYTNSDGSGQCSYVDSSSHSTNVAFPAGTFVVGKLYTLVFSIQISPKQSYAYLNGSYFAGTNPNSGWGNHSGFSVGLSVGKFWQYSQYYGFGGYLYSLGQWYGLRAKELNTQLSRDPFILFRQRPRRVLATQSTTTFSIPSSFRAFTRLADESALKVLADAKAQSEARVFTEKAAASAFKALAEQAVESALKVFGQAQADSILQVLARAESSSAFTVQTEADQPSAYRVMTQLGQAAAFQARAEQRAPSAMRAFTEQAAASAFAVLNQNEVVAASAFRVFTESTQASECLVFASAEQSSAFTALNQSVQDAAFKAFAQQASQSAWRVQTQGNRTVAFRVLTQAEARSALKTFAETLTPSAFAVFSNIIEVTAKPVAVVEIVRREFVVPAPARQFITPVPQRTFITEVRL